MRHADTKVLIIGSKLIGLLCLAFVVIIYTPQYAHHILLVISVVFIFLGVGFLHKYTQQANWVQGAATLRSVTECVEEVTISAYSRLKYYYPKVEYQYITNGTTHLGHTVSFEKENVWVPAVNNWGDPTPEENRWWLSLKPGDELPVYVNPHDAGEAVLIKDIAKQRRSHHLAILLCGIIIGLIWLLLVNYNLTLPSSS